MSSVQDDRGRFANVISGADDPMDFYCTSNATSYRYRGHIGEVELEKTSTGYSRNSNENSVQQYCTDVDQDRQQSHFRDAYTRDTARLPTGIADNCAPTKAQGPYCKHNSFHYMAKMKSPDTSMYASSFQAPPLFTNEKQGETAAPSSVKMLHDNGYTRNNKPAEEPWTGSRKRDYETEYEKQFEYPADIDGQPLHPSIQKHHIPSNVLHKGMSGYSKGQQPPTTTERVEPAVTDYKTSFTVPKVHEQPLSMDVLSSPLEATGYVRNECGGINDDKPMASRPSRKGGVWRRHEHEGNIALHKHHAPLMNEKVRENPFQAETPLATAPTKNEIPDFRKIPTNVLKGPKRTHWGL